MALDVIEGVERFLVDDGEGTGGQDADEQTAAQPGAVGDGDGVDVVPGAATLREGVVNHGVDGLEVAAGGDFGHHAAVFAVNVYLRHNNI